jgi:transcriptional regulator GlxA family with amidase domain
MRVRETLHSRYARQVQNGVRQFQPFGRHFAIDAQLITSAGIAICVPA